MEDTIKILAIIVISVLWIAKSYRKVQQAPRPEIDPHAAPEPAPAVRAETMPVTPPPPPVPPIPAITPEPAREKPIMPLDTDDDNPPVDFDLRQAVISSTILHRKYE